MAIARNLLLFISDLHLDETRPEKLDLLRALLQGSAKHAKALYVLGDIFEQFWIGTDDNSTTNLTVTKLFAEYTKTSPNTLFIMRGNRDFYLNKAFQIATGCHLIDEPYLVRLGHENILLMHGDLLCTQDKSYQFYRKIVTLNQVRRLFMALPIAVRKTIAHGVRSATHSTNNQESYVLVDVCQHAVNDVMRAHKVQTLIHGHTHQEGIHEFELDSKAVKRIVTGSWYKKDSVLVCHQNEFNLIRVEECIKNVLTD